MSSLGLDCGKSYDKSLTFIWPTKLVRGSPGEQMKISAGPETIPYPLTKLFLTMRSKTAPWYRNPQSLWEGCSVCIYNMKSSTMGFASVIHDTKGNKGILKGISVLPIFKAKARQNDLRWQLKPAPADYHSWTWHLLSQNFLTQIKVLTFIVLFWGGGIKWWP